MSERLRFKKGNTFLLDCQFKGGSIDGWAIKSQIRKRGKLIAELTPTVVDAGIGSFRLEYDGDTSEWPLTSLSCDIRYTTSTGLVVSTETFIIDVIAGITHDLP